MPISVKNTMKWAKTGRNMPTTHTRKAGPAGRLIIPKIFMAMAANSPAFSIRYLVVAVVDQGERIRALTAGRILKRLLNYLSKTRLMVQRGKLHWMAQN